MKHMLIDPCPHSALELPHAWPFDFLAQWLLMPLAGFLTAAMTVHLWINRGWLLGMEQPFVAVADWRRARERTQNLLAASRIRHESKNAPWVVGTIKVTHQYQEMLNMCPCWRCKARLYTHVAQDGELVAAACLMGAAAVGVGYVHEPLRLDKLSYGLLAGGWALLKALIWHTWTHKLASACRYAFFHVSMWDIINITRVILFPLGRLVPSWLHPSSCRTYDPEKSNLPKVYIARVKSIEFILGVIILAGAAASMSSWEQGPRIVQAAARAYNAAHAVVEWGTGSIAAWMTGGVAVLLIWQVTTFLVYICAGVQWQGEYARKAEQVKSIYKGFMGTHGSQRDMSTHVLKEMMHRMMHPAPTYGSSLSTTFWFAFRVVIMVLWGVAVIRWATDTRLGKPYQTAADFKCSITHPMDKIVQCRWYTLWLWCSEHPLDDAEQQQRVWPERARPRPPPPPHVQTGAAEKHRPSRPPPLRAPSVEEVTCGFTWKDALTDFSQQYVSSPSRRPPPASPPPAASPPSAPEQAPSAPKASQQQKKPAPAPSTPPPPTAQTHKRTAPPPAAARRPASTPKQNPHAEVYEEDLDDSYLSEDEDGLDLRHVQQLRAKLEAALPPAPQLRMSHDQGHASHGCTQFPLCELLVRAMS